MDIKEILYLIALCVVGVYAIVATAIAVIRMVHKKIKNGESLTPESVSKDLSEISEEISEQVIDLVNETETMFKSLTGATGVKTGPLKLDSVLNKTRDICAEKQVPFDKERWTAFIKKAVNLLNNGREVKSEDTNTNNNTTVA